MIFQRVQAPLFSLHWNEPNPCGEMAKVLNCILEVSEFELRSYVHFRTNTLAKSMSPCNRLNRKKMYEASLHDYPSKTKQKNKKTIFISSLSSFFGSRISISGLSFFTCLTSVNWRQNVSPEREVFFFMNAQEKTKTKKKNSPKTSQTKIPLLPISYW